MCEFDQDYKSFDVTEHQMLFLDEYAEEKYADPEIQAVGFFKVKVKDAKRGTELKTILDLYKKGIQNNVESYGVMAPPRYESAAADQSAAKLYAIKKNSFHVGSKDVSDFVARVTDPKSYLASKQKHSCCMRALSKGLNIYVDHFFTHIKDHANSAPVLKVDADDHLSKTTIHKFKELNKFQALTTLQSKIDHIKHKILSEHVNEPEEEEEEAAKSTNFEFKPCTSSVCRSCVYGLKAKLENEDHDPSRHVLYSAGIDEGGEDFVYFTENYSMKCFSYRSMLTLLDGLFDGISYPQLYVGGEHSYFGLHVEDASLWSINILLYGGPKIWIIVPPEHVGRLTAALLKDGFGDRSFRCINILGHKKYIPNLDWLRSHNIPFSVVLQEAGEALILLPNAAHSGMNGSANIAQAANFMTKSSIPYSIVYPGCTCLSNFGASAVHQLDVSKIVGAYANTLLKEYLNCKDISGKVDDPHFQRSTVIQVQQERPFHFASGSEDILKCQYCARKWVGRKPRKETVVDHYMLRHEDQLHLRKTTRFLQSHFPSYEEPTLPKVKKHK